MFSALLKTEVLSDISRDIGQVFFASLFVGQILENTVHLKTMVVGLGLALVFWFFSVLFAKE